MEAKFKEIAQKLYEIQEKIIYLKDLAKEEAARLKEICRNETTAFGEYTYAKIDRKGSVQYKLIPELEGLDLEQYRNDIVVSWKLSYKKQFDI